MASTPADIQKLKEILLKNLDESVIANSSVFQPNNINDSDVPSRQGGA